MKFINHSLLAMALGMTVIPAMAGDVKLSTNKPVGQAITVATNPGVNATITWGDGTKETFYSDAMPKEFIVKSDNLTISSDDDITALYLPNDGLTSISVIGIRATLQRLYCPGNELTELDLGPATKLTTLDCQDNQLTSLRFGSKVMKSINSAGNKLTTTNLNAVSELTELVCSGNEMAEVEGDAKMAKIKVLMAQGNELGKLDLTKATSLKRLVASNNKLATLTLNSAALTDLMASYNKLDTLDISKAKKLVEVIAGYNELNEVKWAPACSTTVNYVGLNDNALFFNSMPVVYDNRQRVYTLEASLTPQRPHKIAETLNSNETYNWKDIIVYNGWGKVVQTEVDFTDNNGHQLISGEDYTYSVGNVTFKKEFNIIRLSETSRFYPDITLTSEPFNVVSTSGIQNLTEAKASPTTTYTLSGIRVDDKVARKGIYIVNGKKRVIK